MGRGMNLSEFKAALASDATIERDDLKEKFEKLKDESSKKIEELNEDIKQYKREIEQLGNRCFVLTKGSVCLSCQIDGCKYAYTNEDLEAAANYMKKNKIARTDENWLLMIEWLMKRRANRMKNMEK